MFDFASHRSPCFLHWRRDAVFGLDVDHGRAYRLERQCADPAGLLDHPRSGGGAVYASGTLVHGAFGDYKMLDERTVSGPLVHRTKIFVLLKVLPQFDFQLGLDHVALWGGTDPATGQPVMPVTLDNCFRVIT